MYGKHCIRTYCSNHSCIALSSAEAEYYGLVKAGSVALGLRSLYADLDQSIKIDLYTDASAAKAIATRRGLGKVRHMAVHLMWLQEKVANGELQILKVRGEANPADLLTKYLAQEIMHRHMRCIGYAIEEGRATACPELAQE